MKKQTGIRLRKLIERLIKEETSKKIDDFVNNATPLQFFQILNDRLGIRIYSGVSNFLRDADKGKDRFRSYLENGISTGKFTIRDVEAEIDEYARINRRYS